MSTVSPESSTAAAVMNLSARLGDEGGGGDDPIVAGLRRSSWIKIGVVTFLFLAIFWPNLTRIWGKVNPFTGDANWQHGVFVPLVSLYFIYINREELLRTPVRHSWAGLGVLVAGLLLSMYSVWPLQNDFVWDFGMVLTLFGAVLLLCGWQVMKIVWFPIAFLVCAIPWPGLFYSEIAGPLQQLASRVAVKVMQLGGIDAMRTGTKIIFSTRNNEPRTLNVAEACAGLRSLMTFISLAGAVAFLSARPLWQRAIIVLSAIPIAIFCNVMRVSGQGLMDYYVSQQFASGFAHTFFGLVMLIPAFFMILTVVWILDHLFIDEADEQEKAKLAASARAKLIVAKPQATTAGAAAPAVAAAAAAVAPRQAAKPAPVRAASSAAVAQQQPRPAAAGQPKPASAAPPQSASRAAAPAAAAAAAQRPAAPAPAAPRPAGTTPAAAARPATAAGQPVRRPAAATPAGAAPAAAPRPAQAAPKPSQPAAPQRKPAAPAPNVPQQQPQSAPPPAARPTKPQNPEGSR